MFPHSLVWLIPTHFFFLSQLRGNILWEAFLFCCSLFTIVFLKFSTKLGKYLLIVWITALHRFYHDQSHCDSLAGITSTLGIFNPPSTMSVIYNFETQNQSSTSMLKDHPSMDYGIKQKLKFCIMAHKAIHNIISKDFLLYVHQPSLPSPESCSPSPNGFSSNKQDIPTFSVFSYYSLLI